jgi:hypothetical protein
MINSGCYVIGNFFNIFNHELQGQLLDLWIQYVLKHSFFCKLNFRNQYCCIYSNLDIQVLATIKHWTILPPKKLKIGHQNPSSFLKWGIQ